jgi:hypothetical protein
MFPSSTPLTSTSWRWGTGEHEFRPRPYTDISDQGDVAQVSKCLYLTVAECQTQGAGETGGSATDLTLSGLTVYCGGAFGLNGVNQM